MRTTVYRTHPDVYDNARAVVEGDGTLTIVNDPDDVVLETYPPGNWVDARTTGAED